MAENTNNSAVLETEEELTSYTTETNAGAGTGTSAIAPGYGTGRRKEAVARVRLVPGKPCAMRCPFWTPAPVSLQRSTQTWCAAWRV